MRETANRPQCELCGEPAVYPITGSLYFCEDCRDDIGEEWGDVITVEDIDDGNGWED